MRHHWHQGEHIAIVGTTGRGKTTLAYPLMRLRRYTLLLGVKPRDSTLDAFLESGEYQRVYKAPLPRVTPDMVRKGIPQHLLFWDKPKTMSSTFDQAARIAPILTDAYERGGRAILFDDLNHLVDIGLRQYVKSFYRLGRSNGISCVGCMTRPRDIPRDSVAQVMYVMSFKTNDREDVRRIAEMAGTDRAIYEYANEHLGDHDFCFVRNGETLIVRQ